MYFQGKLVDVFNGRPEKSTHDNSSSIYKVIRPVLNFFFTIRFYKHQKALKTPKGTKK